jgi:hypothetical protein
VDGILVIPQHYLNNTVFTVVVDEEEVGSISGNSLEVGVPKAGPVFIHGGAFSPPGYPYFRVNLDKGMNKIKCRVMCEGLGVDVNCVFVLFNDIKEGGVEDDIKMYIENNK